MEPVAVIVGLTFIGLSYGLASRNAIRKETTMAETTSKEVEAKELISAEQIDDLLKTNAVQIGDTLVHGIQLLSHKFTAVINHLLTREPWGIDHLVFNHEYPTDKYGMFNTLRKLVVINLNQHWESAAKLIQRDDHHLSLRGHLWHNMLLTVLHELVHGKAHLTGPEEFAAMSREQKDDMAEEIASEELEALAKEFNIEPSPMAEEPFFGTRYMQLFIDSISSSEETWAVRQNELHDEKHIYLDETGDVLVDTFREYLRGTFDPKLKDKTWDVEVQELAIFAVPVVVAEALAMIEHDPKTIVIDETGTAIVPAVVQPTPEVGMVEPDDLSISEGWEDEALMHLLGEGDTVSIEPSISMVPGAGAPMTAAPIAEEPIVGALFCNICGSNLPAAGATCMVCFGRGTATAPAQAASAMGAPTPAGQSEAPWQTTEGVDAQYNPAHEPHSAWQTAYNTPQQTHMQNKRIETLDSNLPPHNLTTDQMSNIIKEVYMRLYNFCFDKCGWQMPLSANVLQDQTGTLCRDGFNRDFRDAVIGGISVADIPGVNQLIYAYRSLAADGQYRKIPADGMLRGWIAKDAKIPMFNLYLNVNAGEALKRVFIPQNPYKVKRGRYTDTAMQAQGGAKLAYVINGDDRIPDDDKRKYVADIKAGVLNIKKLN